MPFQSISPLKSPTTRQISDMQGIHVKMTSDIVILMPLFAPTKTQTIMVQTESLYQLRHLIHCLLFPYIYLTYSGGFVGL